MCTMRQIKTALCPCCNVSLQILVNEDDCIELRLVEESLTELSKETRETFRIEFG
jgi:hypothetical protein